MWGNWKSMYFFFSKIIIVILYFMPHFSVAQVGEIKITKEKKIDKIIELKINSNKFIIECLNGILF